MLGDDSASVRMAGVHAMANLADDWTDPEGRQMCIDVLCSHLRPAATTSWQGHDFDLRGITIDLDLDFSGAEFTAGHLQFDGCHFTDSEVDFRLARFSGGEVTFNKATFSDGRVTFDNAEFDGGIVDFSAVADWSAPPSGLPDHAPGLRLRTTGLHLREPRELDDALPSQDTGG